MSFELRSIPHEQPMSEVLALVVPPLDADTAAMLGDGLAQMRGVADPPLWGNYLAWRHGVTVGCCGFKYRADGPPEIGYMTFSRAEGTGVATAMADALVTIAGRNGAALVIAHTLPETNASNRALVRNGFTLAGDAEDPDEGPVWRWEYVTRR